MSTELTGTATYRATVTVPVDGDTRNAASVQAGFQDCADSLACHEGRFLGTTTWPLPSGTITIGAGTIGTGTTGNWVFNTTTTQFKGRAYFDAGSFATGVETYFNTGATLDVGAYAYTGTGKPVYRVATLADANATITINDADVFMMYANPAADRTITLGATGAQAGCRIVISAYSASLGAGHQLIIKNSAAATIITLGTTNYGCEFVHNGTDWVVVGRFA